MSRAEGPEGPFISPWASKKHFLIHTLRRDKPIWAVVTNGQQPADSNLIFESRRDGLRWLTDNGFEMVHK